MSLSYSIRSSPTLTFSFVDLNPCRCLFICPLSVAGDDSGRYFLIEVGVSPGQVGSWLFVTALSNVRLGGLNRH